MKKRIGISFTKTNFSNYWNWFRPEELDDRFELVKLSFLENNLHDIETCDGFILTGGIDIEPSRYRGEPVYDHMPDEFQSERDQFEEQIFRHAIARGKPVLGICRGMQLVNVLQGGKLIQDLAGSNVIHRKEEDDKEHRVFVEEGSLLGEITGRLDGMVNSAHHQVVDPQGLGKNIMINAYAGEGQQVVEGIEFRDKRGLPFMLCVQWHPERMKSGEKSPFSGNIRSRFLEEVKKSSQSVHADH